MNAVLKQIHLTIDYQCPNCPFVHTFYYPNVPNGEHFCSGCNQTIIIEPIESLDINIKYKEYKPSPLPKLNINKKTTGFVTGNVTTPTNPITGNVYDECILALEGLGSKKKSVNKEIVNGYFQKSKNPSLDEFLRIGIPKR